MLEIDSSGRTLISHKNGQKTHYIIDNFTDPWKPCETILIQHGFGRHAEFWYHWIPILARKYQVIRRDLRGHGHSSYPQPNQEYDWSVDTILNEIVDLLDDLKIEKVHFLGESTGGMLGEIFAAKNPQRVQSLTICSSPTYLPPAALQLFAFDKKDWPTACRELGSRGWALALSNIPGTIPIQDPDYLPWYLSQIAISNGEGLAQYAGFLSTLDARPYLAQIKVPMLILAPSQSAATKVEEQEMIAEETGGKLKVIDGPGHEIYVTMAEECQKEFLEFLDGV
ncbi:alpha/beta-hydrolase [Amniculicola lignicola CBS 123094]|uniref:Alpha/beta-hydrolase n=1 Tax=Amniculicola lignicola CBS 123094 TaxID=1392246 RepID=A0A6A5WIZ3_9PLEO|nr:alpha/beta-hydrolase [Amniculicola lignicola CBS 123094]